VTLYMPMIPELAMTMLACARIGAIHSIVFAGFSSESLRGRIEDCSSKWVFTADEGKRGGKTIELKKTVDAVSNTDNPYAVLLRTISNFNPCTAISHASIIACARFICCRLWINARV
jgi:acetyl-CoA synthetase